MSNVQGKSKILALSFAVVAAGYLASFTTHTRAETSAASAQSPDIAKLQQEHLATLREAVKFEDTLYTSGGASYEDRARLNRALVEAELKYAPSSNDRITILRNALDAARDDEKTLSQMHAIGLANSLTVLDAKSYRLSLEVALAEETGK
jgi:hypothetical protein